MDVTELTDEQLEQLIHEAQDEREALRQRAKVLADEHTRRYHAAAADAVSDEVKAHIIKAASIESQEQVNG